MGEHICVQAPGPSSSKRRLFDASSKPSFSSATRGVMKPFKAPPARIDAAFANRPSALPTRGEFNSRQAGFRSISPTISETSERSRRTLLRSATSPTTIRPPSPGVSLSQDGAFPAFPTSKSRSTTPTTPSDPSRTFMADGPGIRTQPETTVFRGPPSPKRNGSNLLQRMNSIAPGPFNISNPTKQHSSGYQRTATTINNKDFVRSSNSSSGSDHSRQGSISNTARSRDPSLSSIAGGPRSTLHHITTDSPTLPDVPPFLTNLSMSPERNKAAKPSQPIEPLSQAGRSYTYPLEGRQELKSEKEKPLSNRRPSEPAVAAVMKPLHEIGSTSTFKSSRSLKGRNMEPTTDANENGVFEPKPTPKQALVNDSTIKERPPMPKSTHAQDFGHMNPYHTPTESNSSNESSGSDSRSVSSRSTPPLSGSPQRSKRRPSQAGHIDNLLHEFRFGTEQVPIVQEPVPPGRAAPLSFSRPIYSRPVETPPLLKEPATLSPDSPTDPAIQHGRPLLANTPSDYNAPTVPLQNGNLRLSPAPPPPPAVPASPVRKPTTANKGKCRGCDELIKGKSVSSADGRLTGRYHRNCFVCKTCKEPFQTADFYILDNHPFCARHYHQLNGSLCKTCDKGIEGQYLETELKQKFHPYCFTCQVNTRRQMFDTLPRSLCTNPSVTGMP
ncbi:MAG: hypothetical protein Q9170_000901 [Blastenia crenularia]